MTIYTVEFPKSMAKSYETSSKKEAFDLAEEGMRHGNGNAVVAQWKGYSTNTLVRTWHVRTKRHRDYEYSSWVERKVRSR